MEIGMLYKGEGVHSAHHGFANAINADLVDCNGPRQLNSDSLLTDISSITTIPSYDVYISEGSQPLYTSCLKSMMDRDSKLIYLCADHGLFQLGKHSFSGSSPLKTLIGKFGTGIVKIIGEFTIDGVIAISEFAKEYCQEALGDKVPIRTATPYIQPDIYQALKKVNPSINSNTAVTIARNGWYKGIDLLVEAWPQVRHSYPDATLHIIGKGHPKRYGDISGVTQHGYVENLETILKNASLYIQPSRVDGFGVSVVEGMIAGLPAIVTKTTGAKMAVRRVDENLLCDPTPDSLASTIINYFNMSLPNRQERSTNSRQVASNYNQEAKLPEFVEAFSDLVEI